METTIETTMETATHMTMEQRIAALAVEAVQNHGIPQRKIILAITDALEMASEGLLPTRVLLNAHGGYGMSRAFLDWNATHDDGDLCGDVDSDTARVRLAGRMEAFGAHVAARHPSIPAIVSVLGSPAGRALKAKLYAARGCQAAEQTLANIDANLRDLDDALAYSRFLWKGSKTAPMTRYTLLADRNDLLRSYMMRKHTRESAQAFRDTVDVAELRREFREAADDAGWSAGLPTEVSAAIAAYRDPPKIEVSGRCVCFMDSFVAAGTGEGCDRVRVWFSIPRDTIEASAATFLAGVLAEGEGPVHRYYFTEDGGCAGVPNETIGLLAASGSHARLAIEEAPLLASWQVGEYDGLEHVIVD